MPINDLPEGSLYNILGVSVYASTEEIWFAYFQKVIEIEESDNANARSKDLQEATQAYQVLSDPASKEAYSLYMRIPPMQMLDSAVIRDMVFGSEVFKNYVGDLKPGWESLVSVVKDKDDRGTTDDHMKKVLKKKEEVLDEKVPQLADFMEKELQSNALEKRARSEAQALINKCEYGEAILKTIGAIYKSKAKELRRQVDRESSYSLCQKEATLWKVCEEVLNENKPEKKILADKLQKLGKILTNLQGNNRTMTVTKKSRNGISSFIKSIGRAASEELKNASKKLEAIGDGTLLPDRM